MADENFLSNIIKSMLPQSRRHAGHHIDEPTNILNPQMQWKNPTTTTNTGSTDMFDKKSLSHTSYPSFFCNWFPVGSSHHRRS